MKGTFLFVLVPLSFANFCWIKIGKQHCIKSCPFCFSNMKKIFGNTEALKDEKFYKIPFKYEKSDEGKGCRRNDDSSTELHLYKLLPSCPSMSSCQSLGEWKFQMLISRINRMFARKSLRNPEHLLYFLPIGPFPDFIHEYRDENLHRSLFQLMAEFIRAFFPGSNVRQLPEVNISEISSPTSRHHSLTGKLQYLVSDILNFLRKKLPSDGFAIIGLTWYDMYPCEDMNFILGQGSSHHSACVSSFGRFDPNYVRGFKGQENGVMPEEMQDVTEIDENILWKLMKVVSHETCHVFGVSHCTVFECLMNASSSTHEALSQPLYLCPLCMSKIQHLHSIIRSAAKPNEITVKGHFSSLLEFLNSLFISEQHTRSPNSSIAGTISWLENMISYLDE